VSASLRLSALQPFDKLRASWFFEAEEDADFGFFAFEGTAQIADLCDADAAAFNREKNLFGFAGLVVVEVEASVDATVGSALLFGGSRANLS
jgi:hypothetical protein